MGTHPIFESDFDCLTVTKIFRMNCFKIAKEKFTYRTDFSRNFIRELALSLVISGALRIILLHIPDLKLRIDTTEIYVDVAADFLSQKLNWLKQSPGGLKLNPQLTGFLTQLCYHHIMIWQNYAKHVLFQIDNYGHCVLYCSYFSIPFTLAIIADLVSLLTLHFYCFYIYSLRLYQFWIHALGDFWRLFRGLKFNPLKKRVDSIYEERDTDRFILGAMLFSIFIFLLPTVLTFYLLFASIRLLCVVIQTIIFIPKELVFPSPINNKSNISLPKKILYGHIIDS